MDEFPWWSAPFVGGFVGALIGIGLSWQPRQNQVDLPAVGIIALSAGIGLVAGIVIFLVEFFRNRESTYDLTGIEVEDSLLPSVITVFGVIFSLVPFLGIFLGIAAL